MSKAAKTKEQKIDPRITLRSRLDVLFGQDLEIEGLAVKFRGLISEVGAPLAIDALIKHLEGTPKIKPEKLFGMLQLVRSQEIVDYLSQQIRNNKSLSGSTKSVMTVFLRAMGETVEVQEPERQPAPPPHKQPLSPEVQASIKNVEDDKYIFWLCWLVGGFLRQGDGNIVAMDYAIRLMPTGGAVIEIGSLLGLSTNILAYMTIKYRRDNPFFTCDPWELEDTGEMVSGYYNFGTRVYRDYIKETFIRNCQTVSPSRIPHTIESYSGPFFAAWREGAQKTDVFGRPVTLGGPISFTYIDGAHAYGPVKQDFLDVDRSLLPGGFILFDDSADGSGWDVNRVVKEVQENPAYELVLKAPNYLFRKKG